MKHVKLTIVSILLFITASSIAQEKKENYFKKTPKHELSFDILELVVLNKFEIKYHHLLNPSESIGVTLVLNPSDYSLYDDFYYSEKFSIAFNYRHYFSNKNNEGFFIEAIAKYTFAHHLLDSYYMTAGNYAPSHSIDIGFGVGYKYVSRKNIFIELEAQLVRKLYVSKPPINYYTPKIIPSVSLSIGKRF